MLEKEGCDWLGAYKFCKKRNYVTESLHRIDTIYRPNMPDVQLEEHRIYQLFLMTESGHAMSLDELNELLNLWNKGTVQSSIFEDVCQRSAHIMLS